MNVRISIEGLERKFVTFLLAASVWLWKGDITGCKLPQLILDPTHTFGEMRGGRTCNRTLRKFEITISRHFNLNKNRSVMKNKKTAEAGLIIPNGGSVIT
jgi:hypothetical protein